MRIRVVSSREEIFTLNPNERLVHLAFRPSNKDIFGLIETCPICGHEFVVLEKVEKKAIYCTLECLSVAQGKINKKAPRVISA